VNGAWIQAKLPPAIHPELDMDKHPGISLRAALVWALCLNLVSLGCLPAANAQVVGTSAFNQSLTRDAQLARVNGFLAQDAVRAQLIQLGVDPQDAQARVAALTDSELAKLNQRLDKLPAGGDVLAVIGIVFVVLLILELTGVINIFKNF
jgi:Family of unknown function (DUF6627)